MNDIFKKIRKPIPPPNKVETPKSVYDRKAEKGKLRKEVEE